MKNIIKTTYGEPWSEQNKKTGFFLVRWRENYLYDDGSKVTRKVSESIGQLASQVPLKLKERAQENFNKEHGRPSENVTVEKFYETFIRAWELDESQPLTIEFYQNNLKLFRKLYGHYKLKDLSRDTIDTFKDDYLAMCGPYGKKHTTNGVLVKLRAITTFLDYAVYKELIKENPAKNVKRPAEKQVGRAISPEEIERILRVEFKDKRTEHLFREVIFTFLWTGFGLKELLTCAKESLVNRYDAAGAIIGKSITVEHWKRKVKKTKTVSLHPSLWYLFDRVESGLIFPTMNRSRLHTLWRIAKRRAKIPAKTPDGHTIRTGIHDLRHTCASWLIMYCGYNQADVAEHLGHARITTTDRYKHLAREYMDKKIMGTSMPVQAPSILSGQFSGHLEQKIAYDCTIVQKQGNGI